MFLRHEVRQKNWKNKINESFSEFKALKIQFDKYIEGKSDLSLENLDILVTKIQYMYENIQKRISHDENLIEENIGQWTMLEGLNAKLLSAARIMNSDENYNLEKTDDRDQKFIHKLKVQLDPKWKWKILSEWQKWHEWLEQADSDFKFCDEKNQLLNTFVEGCLKQLKGCFERREFQFPPPNISTSTELNDIEKYVS